MDKRVTETAKPDAAPAWKWLTDATATFRSRWLGLGLSVKLLVLTAVFVMLAEILIFLPSIASYRISWLNDRLMEACTGPEGIAHLERGDLMDDLTVARDFDLGIAGPPLFVSMGFIAAGLQQIAMGLAAAVVLFGFTWWAPLVLLAAWGSTHWLLRESGVWKDRNTDEVRLAQRHADYSYRLAVDPPAAKERPFIITQGGNIDSIDQHLAAGGSFNCPQQCQQRAFARA